MSKLYNTAVYSWHGIYILFLRLHNGSVDQYTKLYKDSGEGKLSDNLRLTRSRTFGHILRLEPETPGHQWIIIVIDEDIK